jgi:hypothetical protein
VSRTRYFMKDPERIGVYGDSIGTQGLRRLGAFLPVIFLLLTCPGIGDALALTGLDVRISSRSIPQGDPGLIRIRVGPGEVPRVSWMKRQVPLVPDQGEAVWTGFLGVDLNARPGLYKVAVRSLPSGLEKDLEVRIIEKDYGVRRLTLPKRMVDLDAETLKRAKREAGIMKALWEAPPTIPLWRGPFLRPVPGDVVGAFGRRSIINNQPRSPHSGVDLKGERGMPVTAVNHGRVAFRGDHFFSGLSVVIDHGGGVQSMYFHLEEIRVQEGQMVDKGEVIGLVGSSGRATGPHLHWGIRINGARVDPMRVTVLSGQLEE